MKLVPPILPLPDDCMSRPSAAAVSDTAAIMLFPASPNLRGLFRANNELEIALMSGRGRADAKALLEKIKAAPNLDEKLRRAMLRGIAAGERVGQVLGGLKPKMSEIDEIASEWLVRSGEPVTAKTISNTVFPALRPVSHLWAAWLWMGTRSLPSTVDEFPDFLVVADHIRRKAEVVKFGQGGTLLRPGESYVAPAAVQVVIDRFWPLLPKSA